MRRLISTLKHTLYLHTQLWSNIDAITLHTTRAPYRQNKLRFLEQANSRNERTRQKKK